MKYQKVNKLVDSDDSDDDEDLFLSTIKRDLQNYDDWGYELEFENPHVLKDRDSTQTNYSQISPENQ